MKILILLKIYVQKYFTEGKYDMAENKTAETKHSTSDKHSPVSL